jgi:predicted TIM-barrel fold metal-dependent hydrolase
MTTDLGFTYFDCDNHYYEALDAFTRHIEPQYRKRAIQWAQIDGKQRLIVGGKVNRFIPNPTFDPVGKPGALDEYFRGRNPRGADLNALFGDLEPIPAAYRDRDARLALMDEQGMLGCIMLPTLGVGMESALEDDPEALLAAFRAFNRWLDEDWGFNFQNRIYGAPYITLVDVDWAVEELKFALERNVGVVLMRPGSVRRTPGDPAHDAFWGLLNESGVTLAIHGGDSGYAPYERIWGLSGETESFRIPTLKRLLSASPIQDTMASLLADDLFDRFPNLRVATIETGSGWVKPLLKKLRSTSIMVPDAFRSDPHEQFLSHVSVSPFFEDDVLALVQLLGPERVVFGSDYPHAEGLEDPASFVKELEGVADADVRKIMHDNARALVTPRPV